MEKIEKPRVSLYTLIKEFDKMLCFKSFASNNDEVTKYIELDNVLGYVCWYLMPDGGIVVETKSETFGMDVINNEVVLSLGFISYYNKWKKERDSILNSFIRHIQRGLSIVTVNTK